MWIFRHGTHIWLTLGGISLIKDPHAAPATALGTVVDTLQLPTKGFDFSWELSGLEEACHSA